MAITSVIIGSAAATLPALGGAAIGGLGLFSSFLLRTAIGLALYALSPKPDLKGANRGYQVTQTGSALDRQVVYGKARVGGVRLFDATNGDNNKYLHRIVAFTGHEIQSFDEIWVDDLLVTGRDSNGNVTEVTDPEGETSNRFNGKLTIKEHLGSPDQLAEPDLVSATFSDGLNWTEEHRLRGISYLYIKLTFDQDVYPNGVPEITATIKGKKVYDPRTGSAAWSDNAALCIRDYISSSDYGLGEPDASINDDYFSAAATVCYQTASNGEANYTCNGSFLTSATPYDNLRAMITSLGGLLWYSQGQWKIKAAKWYAPVLSYNEDDLRSDISIQTRHSRRENFNTVKGTFRGPESDWQVTDFPPVTNSAFITADGGEEASLDLDLPFTDNSEEARRLARIVLERNRQQLTVEASFGLRAFQLEVGDNIFLNLERFGWVNKEFEVVNWNFDVVDDLDLQVRLSLREISESVFDEVDDGIVYEKDNTNLPKAYLDQAPSNLTLVDSGFVAEDGTYVNAIDASWDAPDNEFVSYYQLEWKRAISSVWNSTDLPTKNTLIQPVQDGVEYDVRVRAVNTFGARSPYLEGSHTVGGDVTAPGNPTDFTATGAFKYISLDWTNPADKDFNKIEVWESSDALLVNASKIAEVGTDAYIRPNLGIETTKYYWIKAVDYSGNKSSFVGPQSATTTDITDSDFANGIYSLFTGQGLYAIQDVTSLPAAGDFTGQKVFNRTNGKLYEWNGTAWVLVIAEPDSFIASDKIVANTITGGLLATSGIITNSAQINDAVITNAKIANISADKINTGSLSADYISIDNITLDTDGSGNLIVKAEGVDTEQISGNAVTVLGADTTLSSIIDDSSWVDICEVTVDHVGGNPILIQVTGEVEVNSGAGSPPGPRFRILRDGSQLDISRSGASTAVRNYIKTSVTGSGQVFKLQATDEVLGTSGYTLYDASLIVTEFKR